MSIPQEQDRGFEFFTRPPTWEALGWVNLPPFWCWPPIQRFFFATRKKEREPNCFNTGGTGDDVFVLEDGSGADTITDFDTGDTDGDGFYNDQLNVTKLTDSLGNPVNAWDVVVTDDGLGNALLTFPNGETILLQGVAPSQINTARSLNAAGVPCFTRGTRIETDRGEIAIEDLEAGDLIVTLDHGLQPILWIGSTVVLACGKHAPIEFKKGVFGNKRDLRVSPQHRMMLQGWRQELLFGELATLAPAKFLVNNSTIRRIEGGMVEYFHMLFDKHELIFAEGAPSESFHPGEVGMQSFSDTTKETIYSIFPGLRDDLKTYGSTARTSLKGFEVDLIAPSLHDKQRPTYDVPMAA